MAKRTLQGAVGTNCVLPFGHIDPNSLVWRLEAGGAILIGNL